MDCLYSLKLMENDNDSQSAVFDCYEGPLSIPTTTKFLSTYFLFLSTFTLKKYSENTTKFRFVFEFFTFFVQKRSKFEISGLY